VWYVSPKNSSHGYQETITILQLGTCFQICISKLGLYLHRQNTLITNYIFHSAKNSSQKFSCYFSSFTNMASSFAFQLILKPFCLSHCRIINHCGSPHFFHPTFYFLITFCYYIYIHINTSTFLSIFSNNTNAVAHSHSMKRPLYSLVFHNISHSFCNGWTNLPLLPPITKATVLLNGLRKRLSHINLHSYYRYCISWSSLIAWTYSSRIRGHRLRLPSNFGHHRSQLMHPVGRSHHHPLQRPSTSKIAPNFVHNHMGLRSRIKAFLFSFNICSKSVFPEYSSSQSTPCGLAVTHFCHSRSRLFCIETLFFWPVFNLSNSRITQCLCANNTEQFFVRC